MSQQNNAKILKAGAIYVVGNYLLKGISFLSAPIFTRLLSTSEFGEYSIYCSYEGIIYILVGLALHSSINNAKYKYGDKLNQYISSITVLIMFSTVSWLVFANAFYDFYGGIFGFGRGIANLLILHCFCSSMMQVYNVYISVSYSAGLFLKISAFNGIFNIVFSIALILTVFQEQRTLGRVVGTIIPLILIGIYIVAFFFKKAKPTINREYWRFGLIYSLPIIPHGISQVILSTFDRIMIKNMVGAAEAGIYSFSYTIYSLFKVTSASLEKVWKPWVYEKMEEKDYAAIRKQGMNYAFGMALYTTLVILVAPEIIKILGEKEYWHATPCVVPVVLGGYFAFLYTLPSMIEYFYGKTKYIAIGTMGAAAINVILNLICIQSFGYIAAAYTTLITYILYFAFHYLLAKRIHGSFIFDTRNLIFISIGIVAIGFLVIYLDNNWIIRWLMAIALGIYAMIWSNEKFDLHHKIRSVFRKRK